VFVFGLVGGLFGWFYSGGEIKMIGNYSA
jgi:hypothetical protein